MDFAIIGVQKASTTAIADYLRQCPPIYLPSEKETHFFRRPLTSGGPMGRDIGKLEARFVNAPTDAILGDATPIYTYWPFSLELLKQHNEQIKLIVSLRHPVLRAYSGWSMERRRGREPLSFSEAIRGGRSRVSNAPFGVHHIHSYVERGFYASQVERIFQLFRRDQAFFLRSDQVKPGHAKMANLQSFLGLTPKALVEIKGNINPSSLPPSEDLGVDFHYLQGVYQRDLEELSQMVDIDISDWIAGPPSMDFGK